MRALDYIKEFKGQVLDAESCQVLERNYELLEETIKQLNEKIGCQEKLITLLENQVACLQKENDKFSDKIKV